MQLDIKTLDLNELLSQSYLQDTENQVRYELYVMELEREIFIWIRDIIGFNDLPTPDEFFTFKSEDISSDPYYSIYGVCRLNYTGKNAIIKELQYIGIGITIDRDMTIREFIESVGHEMIHYIIARYAKLSPKKSHGILFKLLTWALNLGLKMNGCDCFRFRYGGYRKRILINPDVLSLKKTVDKILYKLNKKLI